MTNHEQMPETDDPAGEYVLGTLQGPERDAFERRMRRDPELEAEVLAWERRLAGLLESVPSVEPPPGVWRRIESRLDGSVRKGSGLGSGPEFWRGLGLVAAGLLLGLGLSLLGLRQDGAPVMDQMLVVMNDQAQAGWLIGRQGHSSYLQVKALAPTPMPKGKVCQLWLETADGRMISLGVLPDSGSRRVEVPFLPADGGRFKVSIEEADRLPAVRPRGEIIYEGRLTPI